MTPCGHTTHHGPCASCQRARKARLADQNAHAAAARQQWQDEPHPVWDARQALRAIVAREVAHPAW